MPIFDQLISLIAPFECIGCKQEGSLLCPACAAKLPAVPASCYRCGSLYQGWQTCPGCHKHGELDVVVVITSYDRTAKELLHRLKFGRARGAASDIGRIMATRASSPEMPFAPADSLMVPIPTAASRMRSRGYDQVALIARELAVRCDGLSATLLARTGSQRQLGASGDVRRRQMEGAFRVLRSYMLAEHHVVLVDDVLTTGSTLEAAARVLRAAGARRVSAIVFARA